MYSHRAGAWGSLRALAMARRYVATCRACVVMRTWASSAFHRINGSSRSTLISSSQVRIGSWRMVVQYPTRNSKLWRIAISVMDRSFRLFLRS